VAKKKAPAKKPPRGTPGTPKKAPAKSREAPDWAPTFLARLAASANIRASCHAAAVGRSTVYRRRDSDRAFAAAMSDALDDAVDDLELEARRRAHEGCRRVKFHQGDPIMVPLLKGGKPVLNDAGDPALVPYVEHEYSDTLMIFLLKAHRPAVYRETKLDVKVDGPPYKVYAGFDPDKV
jgi:hypothetical protein